MENNPLVSVIIPTYNRQKMLVNAVNSVLTQDYCNMEIIIGRNGGEKITAPSDSRVKIVEWEDNSFDHHNDMMDMAAGEYMTVLHDDDFLFGHDSIRSRIATIHGRYDLVYTDYIVKMKFGTIEMKKTGNVGVSRIISEDCIDYGSMLWRKDIKKTIGGWLDTSLKYNSDWDFKIRCLKNLKCFYYGSTTHVYVKHGCQESEKLRGLDMAERDIIKKRYGGLT